jgi:hypothetical protein
VFIFCYFLECFEHLEREAHYSALRTPMLEVECLIVVIEEYIGDRPLVVVESLGPLRDGFVLYLAWLIAQRA